MFDLLIDAFVGLCLSPIGYIYVRLRYGKQYKEVLEKKYDNSYSTTARSKILQTIALVFTIVLGIGALAAILNLVVKGFKYMVF